MGRHKKHRHADDSSSEDESEDDTDSSGSESDGGDRKRSSPSPKKRKKKEKKKKKKKSRRRSVEDRLTSQDYFLKNQELRVWLKEKKSIYFEDLTSEQARKHFEAFAKYWNRGKLAQKFYEGTLSSGLKRDKTKHDWNFSRVDKTRLDSVVGEVASLTDDQAGFGPVVPAVSASAVSTSKPASVHSAPGKALVGPMLPPGFKPDRTDPEEDRQQRRDAVAAERKRRADFHQRALDELLPKASGHEARIEKRKAAAERKQARGGSPDVDYARVQSGGSSIEKVLAARKSAREQKMEVKQYQAAEKLREYQEKERGRMAEILALAKSNQSRGALWQPKSS